MSRIIAGLVLLGNIAISSTVLASTLTAEAELSYVGVTSVDTFLVSPLITGEFDVSNNLAVKAQWGFVVGEVELGRETIEEYAGFNPSLAISYKPDLGLLPVDLRMGLGVTAPVASLASRTDVGAAAELIMLSSASGSRGSWNPWLYLSDAVSIFAPVSAKLNLGIAELLGEAAIWGVLDTADNSFEREDFGFQAAAQVNLSAGITGLGVRLQAVRATEDVQVSFEPIAMLNLLIVELSARLTLNLTEPAGFSFDRRGVWGAHLTAGLNI